MSGTADHVANERLVPAFLLVFTVAVSAELKGLNSKYALFHQVVLGKTVLDHVLISPDGVLVAPVGSPSRQVLLRIRGDGQGNFIQDELGPVSFVPLLGGIG